MNSFYIKYVENQFNNANSFESDVLFEGYITTCQRYMSTCAVKKLLIANGYRLNPDDADGRYYKVN